MFKHWGMERLTHEVEEVFFRDVKRWMSTYESRECKWSDAFSPQGENEFQTHLTTIIFIICFSLSSILETLHDLPPLFFYLLKFTLLVSLRSKGKWWQIDRNSPLLCLQLVEASQTLSFPKNQCFFTCWCSLCRQAELVLRTFWDRINICQQKPLREKHLPTEIRRANVKWVINSTAHSPQRINYKRWWPDFL